MYKHLYDNTFTTTQIAQIKEKIRGSIFFLLLCVDEKTKHEYENVNVNECFKNLLLRLGGLNDLLLNQVEVVSVMSLLQAALIEYNNPEFSFKKYRKLILDAGAETMKIREGN